MGTRGLVAITWWPPPCSNPLTLSQETETQHSKVVTLYRSHLLYAVQVRWGRGCGGTGDTGVGHQPVTCRGEAARGSIQVQPRGA